MQATLILAATLLGAGNPPLESVKPDTLKGFHDYVRERESAIERDRIRGERFLWVDESTGLLGRVKSGEVVIQPIEGKGIIEIKGGLVHDWLGAAFIPNATLSKVLALVKDYNNHKNIYPPEVVNSRILAQQGDDYKIFLRLLKKKIITVVLDTYHDVHYSTLDPKRTYSRSITTQISEIDGAGSAREREHPPGGGHGFLWKLNSYWRFQERDGGVFIECEAISLTRPIPTGFGWLITPIIRDLPKESLTNTLNSTRNAVR